LVRGRAISGKRLAGDGLLLGRSGCRWCKDAAPDDANYSPQENHQGDKDEGFLFGWCRHGAKMVPGGADPSPFQRDRMRNRAGG
jgi:hypothetical protein